MSDGGEAHPLGFDPAMAFEYENGFYLTSEVRRIGKLLAHHELYRRIIDLPGEVIELGVFRGASLVRWATFRELHESPDSRRIIGFDAFGAFPRPDDPVEAVYAERFDAELGPGIGTADLHRVLERKGLRNVELVAGDVTRTLPAFLAEHRALRVALLHLDLDVRNATATALELLGDRMVPGGLILADDYPTVEGETRAVEAFLQRTGLAIHKLPISHVPAYIVVD